MSDYETGENPTRGSYTRHATPLGQLAARPARVSRRKKDCGPLTPEQLALAEEIWARLPRFDDLVRGER